MFRHNTLPKVQIATYSLPKNPSPIFCKKQSGLYLFRLFSWSLLCGNVAEFCGKQFLFTAKRCILERRRGVQRLPACEERTAWVARCLGLCPPIVVPKRPVERVRVQRGSLCSLPPNFSSGVAPAHMTQDTCGKQVLPTTSIACR